MVERLRIAWFVAVVVAAALLAPAAATTAPDHARASDDDPAGVCVHVRRVDPDNEYCVWLTRAT